MNTKLKAMKSLFTVGLICLLVSACGPGQFLGPTITPSPTSTLTPTITPSPTSTPTLIPTPLPEPGLGIPNSRGAWQLSLNAVRTADMLTMDAGGNATFTPKEGFAILIIDVIIKNLDPTRAIEIYHDNVAILDANNIIYTANGGGWGETSVCVCGIVFSQAVGADNISILARYQDSFFFGSIPSGQPISFIFVVNTEELDQEWQLQFQDVPPIAFKLGDKATSPLNTETTAQASSLPQECQVENVQLAQSESGVVYQEWVEDTRATKLALIDRKPAIDLCKGFAYDSLKLGPDGGILLEAGPARGWANFYLIEPDGRVMSLVRNALAVSGDFVPDTEYVIVAVKQIDNEREELFLYDREKGSMSLLYEGQNIDYRTFPDGVLFIKVRSVDSFAETEYMGPAGTSKLPKLELPEGILSSDIAPDGKHLLFVNYAGGVNRLYVSKLDGNDKQEVVGNYLTYTDKFLSSDGKQVLITADGTTSQVDQAFLHNMETGSAVPISPDSNGVKYSFSPDAKWAVAVSTFDREENDEAKTLKQTLSLFSIEEMEVVKEIEGEIVNYFFSSDGSYLAYTMKNEDLALNMSIVNLIDLSEESIGEGLLTGWSTAQ